MMEPEATSTEQQSCSSCSANGDGHAPAAPPESLSSPLNGFSQEGTSPRPQQTHSEEKPAGEPEEQKEPEKPKATDRAEQVVDNLAAGVAAVTTRWGRRVFWLGNRIREQAQDFWAEVRNIRRGEQE